FFLAYDDRLRAALSNNGLCIVQRKERASGFSINNFGVTSFLARSRLFNRPALRHGKGSRN
ncbi:hypothetical protein, partial [Calothrix sp. UHCC 0171]|uniref:hypothetical protein n=1 Tax=Calothrix sp. UHCC 0171 TaxID=3110245 RepID=UPI002B1ECB90